MRCTSIFLALTSFVLLTSSCEKDETPGTVSADLLDKDWYFAMKPDSAGFRAYQVTPVPSRFIDGFTFASDGTFVHHTFAPNDAALDIPGTWTIVNAEKIHIKPDDRQLREYDILIGTVTPTTLRAQAL